MKAAIISIGNELLSGLTVDTNLSYLSSKLMESGVPVVCGYSVGDDIDMITETLGLAASRADMVLITGGLGPTKDDLTRRALAEFMGVELVFNQSLFRDISDFFESRGYRMAETNRVQAYLPEGAKGLDNKLGTAPGILAEYQNKTFVCMPGVPSEMKAMFEESVQSLFKTGEKVVVSQKLRCFGMGESGMADKLGDLMKRGRNPLINCTCQGSIITLHIVASAENREKCRRMIAEDEKILRGIFGNVIYGQDDETLSSALGEELIRTGKTVATAESCTGGLLAKMIVDIPGCSKYFSSGWVTYANRAKINNLGVEPELIEKNGAVSEEVAAAMATGAKEKAEADIGVGITGIAGPGGGTEQKPVGLVYIGVNIGGKIIVNKYIFSHNRQAVRLRAALTALNMVRLALID